MAPHFDEVHGVNGSRGPTLFLPDEAFYAVVALDPMASVRYLDPEAAIAAGELKARKYLALICPLFGWYDARQAPHYEIDVYFVGRGMPNDPSSQMDESMSVPIHPQAAGKHSESRPPLLPSRPLPWDNCYHYTRIVEYLARSGTIFPSARPYSTIHGPDLDAIKQFCIEDERPSFGTYDTSDSESFSSSEFESISQGSDLLFPQDEGGFEASVPESEGILEGMSTPIPQGLYATYDIWLDLSILTDVPDPLDAKKELLFLDRLQRDYNKREKMRYKELWDQCKAERLRTMTWANGMVVDTKQDNRESRVEIFEQRAATEPLCSIRHSQALAQDLPSFERSGLYRQEMEHPPGVGLGLPRNQGKSETLRANLHNLPRVSYLDLATDH